MLSRKTNSGNVAILCCVDQFTGWPIIKAVPNLTSFLTARIFFQEVVVTWGIPRLIMSDKGTSFMGGFFSELAKLLHITHRSSAATQSRSNGLAENVIQHINQTLKFYAHSDRTLDEILPLIELSLRATAHSRTKISPFKCAFGRKMKISFPGESAAKTSKLPANQLSYYNWLRDHLKKLHQDLKLMKEEVKGSDKLQYDVKHRAKEPQWAIEDKVLLLDKRVKPHSDNI